MWASQLRRSDDESVLQAEPTVNAVVGLGNPGEEYAHTRHNAGFLVVEELARRWQVPWQIGDGSFVYAERREPGRVFLLVKPCTFMNRSGIAIDELMYKFGIDSSQILVLHDDLDLEPGRLRLAARGGSGGHRGMQSIIEHTGSSAIARVKIGIGRPKTEQAVESFVLEPPCAEEADTFQSMILRAGDAVEAVLSHGLSAAMNEFNRRPQSSEGDTTTAAEDAPG